GSPATCNICITQQLQAAQQPSSYAASRQANSSNSGPSRVHQFNAAGEKKKESRSAIGRESDP
ncbi:hypothetical protein Dimus_018212, partial [Dionaea muscipula]